MAVILGAAAGVAEQLAGHRRHRLIHIEQRDALSVVVRSGRVVEALEVLREKRTTFRDRAPLRLTLAAFGSALGLRIGGGFDARHDADMALHIDTHKDDVSGVLLDVCRVARLPRVLRLREWDAPPAVAQASHPRARREAVARTLDDGNAALLELGSARLRLAFQLTRVQLVLHRGGEAPSVARIVQRTGEPFRCVGQLREQQRRRVVDGPAGKFATHLPGEAQQGGVIADLLCRRAGEGGYSFIRDAEIEQLLIRGGSLERLQILAVEVLHRHRLAALDIGVAAHHRREGAQSGELSRRRDVAARRPARSPRRRAGAQ